jgi:flagellar hook-associated protein 3 FlgL
MITRVATFALSDQMIASALRTEATMANLQVQEASGLQSQFLAGYGADAERVVNLQVSVTRAQSYIDAATLADSKAQVMFTALGGTGSGISDIISRLRTALSAATTGSSTAMASLISSAQQMLPEMQSLLNTQYNGEYVFGGARTTTPPVDLSTFATGAGSLTAADTSYYQGDSEIASVQVAADQTVAYGITADNPAFEQVMRVLKFVANSSSLSSADITNALNLASSALDDVATVQAKLSNADAQIVSAKSLQTDYQGFAQTLGSDLSGVDVGALTAQLATYQSQLTASFSAIAKIESLNLASFLR